MSGMTSAPFREVAIHALQVREHRSSLASNLLPEPPRLQALRPRSNKLAPKPLTTSNRRTVSLTMSRGIRQVETVLAPAAPLANPMKRVAGLSAFWAEHPRPDPTLPPTHGRLGPLPQSDLDLDPGRLDHDAVAGPGKPRVEGVG